MIKFREHKYNFVPIEPFRDWVEDIPVRGFGIFSSAESLDNQEAAAASAKQKKKHNKTGSGDSSKASKGGKSKSEIVGRHKEKVAASEDDEVNAERDDPCKAPKTQVEEWEGEGSRRDKRERSQQCVVPYDDKLLWEVSLRIEPRPS
jgi:hypothetical protein